ncbi:PaaX family transcriptional regulator [Microbacterium sp. SLBN-154]|uniref:PaaX family transcriptional regulator n=1 Tax=Microbacterium sp. SLBN-154 TaxID=2768458 RepID=UPI00116B120B|nr:PaaX family transcriptional regulator C-terminal domain-containing protein [Microbacterium sp. SLBN-154]TQK17590.1 PaaX family transcriptional regulator [Microbacterium sp. SLBN-154]
MTDSVDQSEGLDLPRKQVGPNPQHLLITLMGDFWHGRAVAVPSSALVEVLGEFDISPASARSALSRLARRGILSLHRDGRSTAYSVREEFLRAGEGRAMRNLRLGGNERPSGWSGRCVLVMTGAVDESRRERGPLRAYLKSGGFARLQEGVWASVAADEDEVRRSLSDLAVPGVVAFSATLLHQGDVSADRWGIKWPIGDVADAYREFIDDFSPYLEQVRKGLLSSREALIVRTRMMDSWRSIVRQDPDLPDELLPADWPRPRARVIFATLYDDLGPLAEARCRQIIADYDPVVAAQTRHMTTRAVTEG